jgi:hypothetical protein
MNYITDAFIGIIKTLGDCAVIFLRDLGGALFDLKSLIGLLIALIFLIPRLWKFFCKW